MSEEQPDVVTQLMKWKCPSCNHIQPRSDDCENCGTPRPDVVEWIDPGTENVVADAVMIEAIYTVYCDHCSKPYDSRLKSCPNCGDGVTKEDLPPVELRQESSEVAQPGAHSSSAQDYSPEHGRTRWAGTMSPYQPLQERPTQNQWVKNLPWGRIAIFSGLGLAIIAIIAFLVWGSQTHEEKFSVGGFAYNTWREISYITTTSGSCWEGNCPQYTRRTNSGLEPYTDGSEIKIGETPQVCEKASSVKSVCGTKVVDGVKQTFYCTAVPKCTDAHIVYATATPHPRTRIYYEIDTVSYKKIYAGWTEGREPGDPEEVAYTLNYTLHEAFTGKKGIDYKVHLYGKNESTTDFDVSEAQWHQLAPDQIVTGTVNNFGTLTGIK